jgi:RNA polymerase sigma-70 factor, ECF subfamily
MNTVIRNSSASSNEETTCADWVETHGDYLYNFAVGQVRDHSVAEDLVQETFLAALKGRDRFAGRCSERTWLVGILRHKIYDHLRRTCRERAVRSEEPPLRPDQEAWDESVVWLHETADECLAPSRRMELAEFRENLEMALGKLPPRIAQVFQMYEIEERSNPEVCEELQISESNLWVMLHRARKQLREHLSGWWNCEPQCQRTSSKA